MQRFAKLARLTIAAAALMALSGCVAYPVGYYGRPRGYVEAPVVVAPYYGGGWHGRWR